MRKIFVINVFIVIVLVCFEYSKIKEDSKIINTCLYGFLSLGFNGFFKPFRRYKSKLAVILQKINNCKNLKP